MPRATASAAAVVEWCKMKGAKIVKQRPNRFSPSSAVEMGWIRSYLLVWKKNLRFVSFSFVFIVVQLLPGLLVTTYSYSIHLVRMSNDQTHRIQRRMNEWYDTHLFSPYFLISFQRSFCSFGWSVSFCIIFSFICVRFTWSFPYAWVSVLAISSSYCHLVRTIWTVHVFSHWWYNLVVVVWYGCHCCVELPRHRKLLLFCLHAEILCLHTKGIQLNS